MRMISIISSSHHHQDENRVVSPPALTKLAPLPSIAGKVE
jgi:hypothetical protein